MAKIKEIAGSGPARLSPVAGTLYGLNAARPEKISAGRSIRDYCAKVWNIKPPAAQMELVKSENP
jgi:hypothetical protein